MNIIIDILSTILNYINTMINDWGITIIVVTLIIRLILVPLSVKQKQSLELQQKLSKEMEQIKNKYKNDKVKMEQEIAKASSKYSGSMLGCLLTFIQLPIMISLYKAISSIPMEISTTVILPWINNIQMPDTYYIVPIISLVIHLMPNIFYYIRVFKQLELPKPNKAMIITTIIMNALIISHAPVIIGLYWIISGLYNLVEQLITNLIKVKHTKFS